MSGSPSVPAKGIGRVTAVRSHAEYADQLRQRLRFLGIAAIATFPVFALVGFAAGMTTWLAHPAWLFTRPPLLGWMLATLPLDIAIVIALAPERQPSMRLLRAVEWCQYTIGTLLFGVMLYLDIPRVAPTMGDNWMQIDTGYVAAPTAIILLYGMFIPNTWQRCARMVGATVVVTLTFDALALHRAHFSLSFSAIFLAVAAFWLVDAAILAVYGSHRIDILEQDVRAARMMGQYTLAEPLGHGGMGEVYRAEHQLLRRPCAVKVIRAGSGIDATAIARFEREVQATAGLTHPNTVQIYDYGRAEDGTFFYAMEYLPGESLDAIVEREGPMSPERASRILAQLSGALAEAHEHGLVHRDIKPSNVILCERGGMPDVAKLLDFGLVATATPSTAADSKLTEAGLVMGTPEFMSPEQCDGQPVGPASDIYSLGALGYYLLSGRSPFGGRSAMQMLAAHLNEMPTSLRDRGIPPELDAIVLTCLAKQPEDRVASARALEQLLVARPVTAPRVHSTYDRAPV